MRHALLVIGIIVIALQQATAAIHVESMRCEYRENPLGIDVARPRLSWIMTSDKSNQVQKAYEIEVFYPREKTAHGPLDVWSSGRVESDQSNLIEYGGPPLPSGKEAFWKVQVWNRDGETAQSNLFGHWTTGLLNDADWKGQWIGMDVPATQPSATTRPPTSRPLAARYLRKTFSVDQPIVRATAYVCGLGLFELHLNGSKVGDHVLEPALTDYDHRCDYVTFDVTNNVHTGPNAIGVVLGNGRFFAPRDRSHDFGAPRLQMMMNIDFADGSTQVICSDGSWKATDDGPIRANNEYDGETFDATHDLAHWDMNDGDDSAWRSVDVMPAPGGKLAAQDIDPIRITQRITPVNITEPAPNIYIYDMGQNMVGWCRINVRAPRGMIISLRHAETLKPDGNLYTANLRSAAATDTYTCSGNGLETYEPRFTYHGFRYVEITGLTSPLAISDVTGCVLHDDLERAGGFTCSDPLLTKLAQNIFWGVRGNYRSIVTDCPQRDERQGWLGDRAAEAAGETSLFNIAPLYTKWLTDITDSQRPDGSISNVTPPYWSTYRNDVTWPSLDIIAPGTLHEEYGDERVLRTNYPTMQRWIALMKKSVKDGIIANDTYGDWCSPPESPTLIHTNDPLRKTAGPLLATSYYYHDLRLMEGYAKLLGNQEDAIAYASEAEVVAKAFNDKFFDVRASRYDNGSQTSYVLPLAFGLVPADQRSRVFDKLTDSIINTTHNHIGTGLVGGQWLMRTLTENGRLDLAYTLATQRDYPSWGYMVDQGATTVWELWNGNTADPAMNSGNHVMLIGDLYIWMNRYLAGIRPDDKNPGYKHFSIRPMPVGNLTSVDAWRMTPYGKITSKWTIEGNTLLMQFSIPCNTTATVYFPEEVPFTSGLKVLGRPVEIMELGSGDYRYRLSYGTNGLFTGAVRQ